MQIFGRAINYTVDVVTVTAEEIDFSADVSSEHLIKINPNATGVHILLTPSGSTDNADADDYLLPNEETEFLVGRGLDRISFYKEGAGDAKVYVVVLF